MRLKTYLSLAALLMILCSCNKNEPAPAPLPLSNYIKASVEGEPVDSRYKTPGTEKSSNGLFTGEHKLQFNRMAGKTDKRGWNFQITNFDLLNTTLPRTIRFTSRFEDPYLAVTYNNGTGTTAGDFIVSSKDSNLFQVTITHKSGDMLQGTFNGALRWASSTDSLLHFTNGSFRIQLTRF